MFGAFTMTEQKSKGFCRAVAKETTEKKKSELI